MFNYNSSRAKKARLGKVVNHPATKFALVLAAITALAASGYLLFIHNYRGWPLLAAAILAIELLIWNHYELRQPPIGKTDDLNDVLSGDCLAGLPKNPTPENLAHLVKDTRSGRFLAARYGIAPVLLAELAKGQESADQIFKKALEIRQRTRSKEIEGATLAAAIIENYDGHELLLKRLKLDQKTLEGGIIWYNYLYGLVQGSKKRRPDGGIARDLAFGYIPLLQRFGYNLSMRSNLKTRIHQATHQEIINQMLQIFEKQGRQNVALIGPEGSGRTTLVQAFAEELLDASNKLPSNLQFRQIFLLDATSLLAAAPGKGELEHLLIRIMDEAYAAKNIILCFENAHVFFEEATGTVDISNVLQPILEAGNLRIILTLNQQKFLEISTKNPALTNTLNKIMVPPASREETIKIMEDQAPLIEGKQGVIITYLALEEAYRLSERYIHDLEMPGRALSLLENATKYAKNGLVTEDSVKAAIEKTEGVKVQTADSAEDRDKLLNLEQHIHQRMINQTAAVKAVSDALRRAAAGVRSESRPIGTFLFLGPTGVGKTELAKALSEVYFGGENDIIRIDLNEYVAEADVARLIAEATSDPTSLTAQVSKNPFSVVLLDEIEKAHPKVLTTLLQLLDEGILRDAKNREVSFRDTIVIATSNAGANQIREQIANGQTLDKETLTNELIKSGEFKPEFLNRFDEICIFTPLSKPDLIKVVDIMLKGVNKTLAPQKISVHLDDDAKALLVEKGYDPQLGARPMRRIVQKAVENLVARAVLEGQADAGSDIYITSAMISEQLGQ